MNTDKPTLDQRAGNIIRYALKVSNTLGVGFLGKVYENALVHELRKVGLSAAPQADIAVWYDGVAIGKYSADIVVDDIIIDD